jgi:hypothetical protein
MSPIRIIAAAHHTPSPSKCNPAKHAHAAHHAAHACASPSPVSSHLPTPAAWGGVPHVWVWLGLALAGAALVGAVAGLARMPRARRSRLISLRWRVWLRLHPGPGFAKLWELLHAYGLRGPRKQAKRLRPSLTWTDRWLGAPRQYATYLGVHRGFHRLWVGLEEAILLIAPPRSGKSQYLGGRIIDAPGAVVATSLRADLIADTIELRRRPVARTFRHFTATAATCAGIITGIFTGWPGVLSWAPVAALVAAVVEVTIVGGLNHRAKVLAASLPERPVWIFDPQNVSGRGNTLAWSPVIGAEDPRVARAHAAYMIEAVRASGVQNQQFWENSAARALRSMLHAAALDGRTLLDVFKWVINADNKPIQILSTNPRAAAGYLEQANEFINLPEETRRSVVMQLSNALDFMSDPVIAGAVCSPSPRPSTCGTSSRRAARCTWSPTTRAPPPPPRRCSPPSSGPSTTGRGRSPQPKTTTGRPRLRSGGPGGACCPVAVPVSAVSAWTRS